jgi:hypothetical protein
MNLNDIYESTYFLIKLYVCNLICIVLIFI